MKRERKCCYCLEPIRGRGKDAPTPWEVAYVDPEDEYRCCDDCYLEKSGWGSWYRSHEC